MPAVTFQPSNKTTDVPPGTELLDAAGKAGVEIETPCGGEGTCGKCIVRVIDGDVDSESLGLLSGDVVADGYVLACHTKISTGNVIIEIPDQIGYKGGKISEDDETYLIRKELLPQKWQYDPLAVKWLLEVPKPLPEDGLSDIDRLTRTIQQWWGKMHVDYSLRVMRQVADTLRTDNGRVTVTLVRESGRLHVVRIEAGDKTIRHYAVAIDIGTTTIAVQLINLNQAEILGTRSDYNDQVSNGLDVISRINYAARPERLEELRVRVLKTINRLIEKVSRAHTVEPLEITNAVISGNTTMIHLLLGLKPDYIRLEPYTPTVLDSPYLTAAAVGVEINPDSWIYISPSVGSYVGGDITAGLLCTDIALDMDEINLFIDIGTNGEIVLGNSDFLMSCACSAGPAFEGGGIEYGMRAALGAIEKVDVDPKTGIACYSTIGNVKPMGICGSGIIDLLANLFLTGWIDAAGKFDRTRECSRIWVKGKQAHYIIVPADQSDSGKPIILNELDIENIIRAKAAIYSACTLMLKQLEMDFNDLSHVYIAGGFGRFLDLEKAKTIGLVPDLPKEKFHYLGNSSLMGSYMVVVSQEFRERQQALAGRMTYIDLSSDPGYMDQYTGALFIPHTDLSRFPSVKKK
ncbi:MAG: ASKHA domain-containing protein [bacterium]